jgi:hypothetical protein
VTFEVLGHERDQFFIGFAIHWRRLDLGKPSSIFLLLEQAGAGIGFDFYLDHQRHRLYFSIPGSVNKPAEISVKPANMKILKLFLNATIAWALGLVSIAAILYFSNGGADFTITDLTGFGVIAIVVSGLLMLVLYLPSLYWLKRRRGGIKPRIEFVLLTGLLCNIPVFIFLLTLINRKMVLSEALGFIATFLIIGSVFGFGFTLAQQSR